MRTSRPRLVRAVATPALAGPALVVALAGCGGSQDVPAAPRPTVPRTTPTQPVTQDPLASDVAGRRHDVGVVVDTATHGGVTLLRVDRWTVRGVEDATLARDGMPLAAQTDDGMFHNQNAERTYAVPVRTGAIAVLHECVDGDRPGLRSEPVSLAEWLEDERDEDEVVLLTYDDQGRLERLDTVPACEV